MTRVAIPDWHGQVSPVFDVAACVLVVDLEGGLELRRQIVGLSGLTPAGRVFRLEALGVTTLVCGAISRPLEELAGARGIEVVALVSGPVDTVERIVAEGRPIPEACLLPGCVRPRVQSAARAQARLRRASPEPEDRKRG
jgi:predicted Fe-Mo cluster-binding NifX family protein